MAMDEHLDAPFSFEQSIARKGITARVDAPLRELLFLAKACTVYCIEFRTFNLKLLHKSKR
jgi:hypothetical protein